MPINKTLIAVIASAARQSTPPLLATAAVIASEARQSRGHGSPRPFGSRDDDAGAVGATSIPVIASEARQSMPPLPSLTSVIASGRGSLPDMADKIYSRDLFRQD